MSLSFSVGQPIHQMTLQHHIAWVYLYSFQGRQLKFMAPGEESIVMFALADKDAYVYCDRPVCKGHDCKFNCKRVFCV
ncbi:MAG: desulfoferrodoxin family protein [Candidatus Malihini olakiniferum]